MKIPKHLMKLADEIEAAKRREAREATIEEWIRKANQRLKISERLKNGLEYAEKIFDWVRKLRNTPEGKRLIKLGIKNSYRDGIYFFDTHVSGFGWRGLGVSKKGRIWWIQTGCGCREQYVKNPEELASQIESEILKLACETLKGGRVWKCIAERMSD